MIWRRRLRIVLGTLAVAVLFAAGVHALADEPELGPGGHDGSSLGVPSSDIVRPRGTTAIPVAERVLGAHHFSKTFRFVSGLVPAGIAVTLGAGAILASATVRRRRPIGHPARLLARGPPAASWNVPGCGVESRRTLLVVPRGRGVVLVPG